MTRRSQILGYDLAKLCFEGPRDQLNSTVHSQPALFVTSLAALELLKANKPEVVCFRRGDGGLSLGEYTALVFAGVMSFEDGLRVVQQRGRAMQDAADAVPSGMVSILGMEAAQIQELCNQARGEGRSPANRQLPLPRQHRRLRPQSRLCEGRRARRPPPAR